MLHNIDTLQGIYQYCCCGRQLTDDQQRWLGASLGRYLAQECASLNEAFGVVQGHGGVSWWREQAIRRRDAALRALARRFLAGHTVYARAREVARLALRYETTCWPRDRRLASMPECYRGTPKEKLWQAFRSGAKMPVCERRLRSVLGDR